MTMNDIPRLAPTKPDKEVATELRAKMLDALGGVIAVMNEGRDAGLEVNFALARDPLGRGMVQSITISRPL